MIAEFRAIAGIAAGSTLVAHSTPANDLPAIAGSVIAVASIAAWLAMLRSQTTEFVSIRFLLLALIPFAVWCVSALMAIHDAGILTAVKPTPVIDIAALVMFGTALIGDVWGRG